MTHSEKYRNLAVCTDGYSDPIFWEIAWTMMQYRILITRTLDKEVENKYIQYWYQRYKS